MGRYLNRITARFHRQEQKGVLKYGTVLEDNHGNYDYRLEHLTEELTDGLMYCEWLKESGKIISSMFELLVQDLEKDPKIKALIRLWMNFARNIAAAILN